MRTFLQIVILVLYLIALAGLGIAIAMVYSAASGPSGQGKEAGVLAALFAGVFPFLIGTVALGSAAIVTSFEEAREDAQIAMQTHVGAIVSRLDALKASWDADNDNDNDE